MVGFLAGEAHDHSSVFFHESIPKPERAVVANGGLTWKQQLGYLLRGITQRKR
jgi:hypothetical protein